MYAESNQARPQGNSAIAPMSPVRSALSSLSQVTVELSAEVERTIGAYSSGARVHPSPKEDQVGLQPPGDCDLERRINEIANQVRAQIHRLAAHTDACAL